MTDLTAGKSPRDLVAMQELTRPDPMGRLLRRNTSEAVQPWLDLLQPEDSIWSNRGSSDSTLYRETLRDDQCSSTFGQRRLAVVACDWRVEPASTDAADCNAADFCRELLRTLEWDRITDGMLFARWYGYAVGECLWAMDGRHVTLADVRVRDRSRFRFDPLGGLWLVDTLGQPVQLPARKFWTIATGADNDDDPYGLGLGHFCYWPVWFKRNNIRFWLTFVEKFGQPTVKGSAPPGMVEDPHTATQIMDALRAISTDAAVLVPDSVRIELIEATRSGTPDYQTLHSKMDAAIAKIVIGQTASSEGTPGRLGNEQLQTLVRADLIKADADLVCQSFARQVFTWLCAWNFPSARVPSVWRVTDPPTDINARAERDTRVYALGYRPSSQYIEQTYGVGWEAAAPPDQAPAAQAADLAEAASPPPVLATPQVPLLGPLGPSRAGLRQDMDRIDWAAEHLAGQADAIGEQVMQILQMAEQCQDYDQMQRALRSLLAAPVSVPVAESIRNASFVARLLGRLRRQTAD